MNKIIIIAVVFIFLAVGLGYFLGKTTSNPTSVPTPAIEVPTLYVPPPTQRVFQNPTEVATIEPTNAPSSGTTISPVTIVRGFYNSYFDCVNSDEANAPGKNRIQVCGQRHAQYFSAAFYSKVKEAYTHPYDPILCAQAPPVSLVVRPGTVIGNTATVFVLEKYVNQTTLTVNLEKSQTDWFIKDVQCPQ